MTAMFKPRLTTLALIAATFAAGGCAIVPAETSDKPDRESITFNRMKLTPVDDVRVPGMGALPFDGSLEDGVDQAVVSPAAISITAMAAGRSRSSCSGLDEAD